MGGVAKMVFHHRRQPAVISAGGPGAFGSLSSTSYGLFKHLPITH